MARSGRDSVSQRWDHNRVNHALYRFGAANLYSAAQRAGAAPASCSRAQPLGIPMPAADLYSAWPGGHKKAAHRGSSSSYLGDPCGTRTRDLHLEKVASWAGMWPGHHESAGKQHYQKTPMGARDCDWR